VVITGGAGFVGSALVRDLEALGAEVRIVRSAEHDLRDARATRDAVDGAQLVVHLAANVGGIGFNRRNPAPLVYDNMMMAGNVFEQSRQAGVEKLVSACTVCAYPKFTPTPFSEDELWNGYPEETNAPYGLAKKMMLVLSDSYRRQYDFDSVVPMVVNLYGPNDHFSLEDSHVIPAIIRTILDAAEMIARFSGFEGELVWDASKPDGQPTRCLDVSRARERMGFEAQIGLEDGLRKTVEWFRENLADDGATARAPQPSASRL
jgi:GDP-L-fucose synthase